MTSKSWTILFCSHSGRKQGSIRLTTPLLTALLLAMFSLLYFPGKAVVFSVIKAINIHELEKLEIENEELRAQLGQVDRRIARLDTKFDSILVENQMFRQIAGMSRLEDEVLAVGVGGTMMHFDDDLLEFDCRLARRINHQEQSVDELLRRSGLVKSSLHDALVRVSEVSRRWSHLPMLTPTSGYISSPFGRRMHPLFRQMHYHTGLDFSTPSGEPIYAPANGKVVRSGSSHGLGLSVVLDHEFGIRTVYGHCSRLAVESGQDVRRGDVIGYVGRSGITTGPHLHYEVHVDGHPTNPFKYLLDLFPERL